MKEKFVRIKFILKCENEPSIIVSKYEKNELNPMSITTALNLKTLFI